MTCYKSMTYALIMFYFSMFTINALSSKINIMKKTSDVDITGQFEAYRDVVVKKAAKKFEKIARGEDAITPEQFVHFFSNSPFSKIAPRSEEYVLGYFNYFSSKKGGMNLSAFTKFYSLFYLEEQLLISGRHPTLSKQFPNATQVKGGNGNEAALKYWDAILIKDSDLQIKYRTMFGIDLAKITKILTETIGKDAGSKAQRDLDFFSEGDGKKLNQNEFNLLYAYYYFRQSSRNH